jgi:hypothetical protein
MLRIKQPRASFRPVRPRAKQSGSVKIISLWLSESLASDLDFEAAKLGITRRAMLETILSERYAKGKR